MKSNTFHLVTGLVMLLVPALAWGTTHTVNQAGLAFDPDEITIKVGDTVQWIWSGGSHIVTSGTDLNDPEVGDLFDAPLNSNNPSFVYTFTEVGSFDYFCRPHVNFGMTGTVTVTAPSAVGDSPARAAVQLLPNVPNPFNPSTRITFELPADRTGAVDVSLRIFDLKGRLVRVLLEDTMASDRHTVVWNGRNDQGKAAPSGLYVYRLAAGGKTVARTMTLAK